MGTPPALANLLRPHGDYAIIGPGGGVDVLRAVANGSPSVTGIEINPIIANTIMRGRYAAYSNHLYERPDVHIVVTDGRSYLRSTPQRFDVLQMTLVDTWASTAAGAFALSENNLYTVEAFREYFEHLKPDGMIAITRWEFQRPREALRVVSVAMEALHRMGVTDTAHHFIVASMGALNEDGIPVAVLAKKTPFTAEEESAVKAHLAKSIPFHSNLNRSP
jgi:spermidine synthase